MYHYDPPSPARGSSGRSKALDLEPKLCLLAHAVPGLINLYTLANAMDTSINVIYGFCGIAVVIFALLFRNACCQGHFDTLSQRKNPLYCLTLEVVIGGYVGHELMSLLLCLCWYNNTSVKMLCIPVLLTLPSASLILGTYCLWKGFPDPGYARYRGYSRYNDAEKLHDSLLWYGNNLGALAILLTTNAALRLWNWEGNSCAWTAVFILVCMFPFTHQCAAFFCPFGLAETLQRRLGDQAEPCLRRVALVLAAILAVLFSPPVLFRVMPLLSSGVWARAFLTAVEATALVVGAFRWLILVFITLLFSGKRR